MEEKIKTVYSSFNLGDTIASLSGLKKVCDETNSKLIIYFRLDLPMANYFSQQNHPTTNEKGQAVGINRLGFDMLKPLLEAQYYIKEVRIFDGEADFDYNLEESRKFSLLPLPAGQLQTYDSFTYPELACDLSKAWIETWGANRKEWLFDKIIVNKTERYNNPYITYNFLKKYQSNVLFVGTDREWELFNNQWGLNLVKLDVADFYDLANSLMCCKFFIGNQSFCWHLAESMKIKRVLEFCREFPNSSPIGDNGYQFLKQEALLYYFSLLNK